MSHKHGRTDANQPEIVDALRKAGWSVFIASDMGNGFPDLVVSKGGGGTCLMECKMPGEKLTAKEQEFFATWPGWKAVVYGAEDALREVGAI